MTILRAQAVKQVRTIAALYTLSLLAGCNGNQSAIVPWGRAAADIDGLFWWFTAVSTLVWLLVMAALAAGLLRQREVFAGSESTKVSAVTVAAVLTALTVTGLALLSYWTDRKLLSIEGDNPVSIRITGHQWWWELRYEDQQPSRIFSTANEIHIPVGRPVELNLESLDVIHSFWVPSLAGKMDLIPGRHNKMTIDATNPGVYRGQCAEFCGYQHAHMKMLVIAEPSQQFESWKAAQILPAASVEGRAATGQQIFLSSGCVLCHTIRGTRAGGNAAPDLTHFGSRRSVAANTLPLTHSDLVAWIADPQHVKPGANMPKVKLSDDERDAVAIYLEALK